MMWKLVEESRQLAINVSMTKIEELVVGKTQQQQSIELEDGRRIEKCDEYKYLGVRLSQNERMDQGQDHPGE